MSSTINGYTFIKNRKLLLPDDVFIASYPRSGNTWIRLLLADLILQINGFKTSTKLPIHVSQIIPDIYKDNLSNWQSPVPLPCRLIKTHEHYHKIHRQLTRFFWQARAVYIFRNPSDVLCSYYHFHKMHNLLDTTIEVRIDDFCQSKVDEWCNHLTSYISQYSKHKILFVSYEKLYSKPIDVLQKVIFFFGVCATKCQCIEAIENHRFDKQKSIANTEHFRKGKINSAQEELSSKTLEFIEAKTRSIYKKAKEIEGMTQPS